MSADRGTKAGFGAKVQGGGAREGFEEESREESVSL